MRVETYIWTALCSIAYWNHGGLKTRFAISPPAYFTDPMYRGGYSYTLSISD